MSLQIRQTVDLFGILQGVGLRPTLARLIRPTKLGGWCRNQSGTVRLVLEGQEETIEKFLHDLKGGLPRQAKLEQVKIVKREVLQKEHASQIFQILESTTEDRTRISIPTDLTICEDCKVELLTYGNKYYGYPFTTCTNCGPRYTIVDGMPYDRERTSLKEFPLCDSCLKEYNDPENRRFHAESIACPACGPRLTLHDNDSNLIEDKNPILRAREAIKEGKIIAVKGLGGFLLAADARNEEVLEKIRARKHRKHKPLAVMARNISVAKRYCDIGALVQREMESSAGPIAIVNLRENLSASSKIPINLLAPGQNTLGIMLPTTPIHILLAHPLKEDKTEAFDLLVMTSGNRGGEPICITNQEAFHRLSGIADLFLCHNRAINLRNDDSLIAENAGRIQIIRRARGYAPEAIFLKRMLKKNILAMGAELNNTVAIGFEKEVVVSPHIGDLETPPAIDGLERVLTSFPEFYKRIPDIVAVDLHPDMHSTMLGKAFAKKSNLPIIEVQHHHAHAASCMAEHGLNESMALVFDGTGLGSDGNIWGGELLFVEESGFSRLGTFEGARLPGSDAAVKQPIRQLVARCLEAGIEMNAEWLSMFNINIQELKVWQLQCEKGINAPISHSAGRLFDAFSILIGVSPFDVTYEGQGAILLEAAAKSFSGSADDIPPLPFDTEVRHGMLFVDLKKVFIEASKLLPIENKRRPALSVSFHRTMVNAAVEMATHGREVTNINQIVLTGGVMMNRILCELLHKKLAQRGFSVFLPQKMPPGDGAISLGQISIAGGNI